MTATRAAATSDQRARRATSPADGALAGLVAAATALAAGELPAAVARQQVSPITGVSNEFVDRFAGSLKDLAVALFGQHDKVALVVGVVLTALALGALLGAAAVERFPVAVLGFAAFGLLGLWSVLTDPRAEGALVPVLGATLGVIAGVGTLWWLLDRAPARSVDAPAGRPPTGRRAFLAWTGGLAAAAAVTGGVAHALRNRASVAAERMALRLPTPLRRAEVPDTGLVDVDGVSPYVTPTRDFYRIDTALITPQVPVDPWRLTVSGLVREPFELTFAELAAMDVVEEVVTLSCVSNEVGGDLVGNAVWLGVPLGDLLERAGVMPEATQVVGRSVDGFTVGFPTDVALDGRVAMVAIGMNGEPLPVRHGYPARLVVAGLYGYVSATKWLSEIELTRFEDFDAYWVPRGWAKEGPVRTQSRIDVPRSGSTIGPGDAVAAGVAWAPGVGVERVEVRVDGGPWLTADLGATSGTSTWVQWSHRWDATPGEHTLEVRATDATGATQTAERRPPRPDGATGHHRVSVTVGG